MSANTSIEWTDRTWNPVRGCTRISEGCRNCYAERMASRGFSWSKGFAEATPSGPRWTGNVALVPEALEEPLRWRKPQRIFVNSMSDLFHEGLPEDAIDMVFRTMAAAPGHTFQILTKRPARMLAYAERVARQHVNYKEAGGFDWAAAGAVSAVSLTKAGQTYHAWPLPNVWLGVSVEDQAAADERIPLLLKTPAAVRFVSYEPALGPVDFSAYIQHPPMTEGYKMTFGTNEWRGIDWLIVGGESGPGARPFDLAWARTAIEQCEGTDAAVFVKQLGARPRTTNLFEVLDLSCGHTIEDRVASLRFQDRKGGDMTEWPADLRVREFPR